ncbi:MAG: hypothetical protein RJB26_270 [Pseudomonadota bacterium]|jgi:hypothetical protein
MSDAMIPAASAAIVQQQVDNVRRYGAVFAQAAEQGRQAMHTALLSRLLAGAALVALKNVTPHGEFETVCAREFSGTPERTLRDWKARAELDLRHGELKKVTMAVLLDADDGAARGAFEETATKYFATKPTLELNAARDILQLGNGRAERKPEVPRAKLPRGKTADVKRKAFEAAAKVWQTGFKRLAETGAATALDGAHYWDVGTSDEYLAGLLQTVDVIRDGLKASQARRKAARRR